MASGLQRGAFASQNLQERDKTDIIDKKGDLYRALSEGWEAQFNTGGNEPLKVLARLLTVEERMPGYACFRPVLSLFLSLSGMIIPCYSCTFRQETSQPGAIPYGAGIPDRKVLVYDSVSKRELFSFCTSLYNTAFCSGIVGRLVPVSPMVWVYSGGVSPTAQSHVSHIPELICRHFRTSLILKNVEIRRDQAARAQGIVQQ